MNWVTPAVKLKGRKRRGGLRKYNDKLSNIQIVPTSSEAVLHEMCSSPWKSPSLPTESVAGWAAGEVLKFVTGGIFSSLLGIKLFLLDRPAYILVVYICKLTHRRYSPKARHCHYQSRISGHMRCPFHPQRLPIILVLSLFPCPSQSQLVKSVIWLYSKGTLLEFRPEHRLTWDRLRFSSFPRTNAQF